MSRRSATCPRCGDDKHPEQFACRTCWHDLPRDVKREIGKAFRDHGPFSDEWVAAAKHAFEAWGVEIPGWLSGMEEALGPDAKATMKSQITEGGP